MFLRRSSRRRLRCRVTVTLTGETGRKRAGRQSRVNVRSQNLLLSLHNSTTTVLPALTRLLQFFPRGSCWLPTRHPRSTGASVPRPLSPLLPFHGRLLSGFLFSRSPRLAFPSCLLPGLRSPVAQSFETPAVTRLRQFPCLIQFAQTQPTRP